MTIKFTRRSVCALGAAALGCAAFPPFAAEDPIRIIVPYPPGGPLDVTARAVAEEARHDLGNIIVENKPAPAATSAWTTLQNKLRTARPSSWALWQHMP